MTLIRHAFRALVGGASIALLAACVGDGATPPVGTPSDSLPGSTQTTGVIVVTVDGLPSGSLADVVLAPPSGASVVITSTTQLNGVTPGRWHLTALPVTVGSSKYRPDASGIDVTLAKGETLRVPVRYSLATGSIAIAVNGLPNGALGAVTVTGPAGFSQSVSATSTLTALEPGDYAISPATVTVGGITYLATASARTVVVTASPIAAVAAITYQAQAGRVVITTSGLPADLTPTFTLTGADGARTVTGDATIDLLAPGRYELVASTLGAGSSRYAPDVVVTSFTVNVGTSTSIAIRYVRVSTVGSIALDVSGLPQGTAADVLVTGPAGFARVVTGTALLPALAPGRYAITARAVRSAIGMLGVTPPQREIDVAAGDSAAFVLVYAPLPATIEVPVTGAIPVGAARITLTSPSGTAMQVTASRSFEGEPGRWRMTVLSIVSGGSSFAPTPTEYDGSVLAGDTLRMPVAYAISSGSIAIAIAGLPSGTAGSVTVSGPAGYTQTVTSTITLTNLVPGSYTVHANTVTVSSDGRSYAPVIATRTITVTASAVAAPAPIVYALASGRLTIVTAGLPDAAVPAFTLAGTSGSRVLTGAGTTDSLAPGNYTLTANAVSSSGSTYSPTPPVASLTINAGVTTTTSFTYSASGGGPPGPNVSIDNVYVTQAAQNWSGSAPVVVGRQALVRVFVRASGDNSWQPDVRVRIYDGSTLLQTATIPAASASVPTTVSEGTMSASWNMVIPSANVRASLRVLADVDPTAALNELNRADNLWPVNGVPASIVTITAPTLTVRFVPVTIGGTTGSVSDGNREQFLQTARRLLPLNQVSSSVRAPFTSNAPELQSGNGNNAWTTLLSEINVLRTTDGTAATAHYVGVVKANYGSGFAGFGYIPGRAMVVWDNMPSADAVTAHELGHNFSRPHTPCGVSGDPAYPYPGGVIGVWGWNASSNALVSPGATDIMGYCGNQWISDWSWTKMAEWRTLSGVEAAAGTVGDALLVWGRITDGHIVLEPAFRVRARTTPRPGISSHRLVLFDADGTRRDEIPIGAESVDHQLGHDERQFAVILPWSDQLERDITRIAVVDVKSPFPAAVRTSAVRAPRGAALMMPDPDVKLKDALEHRSEVQWDAAHYPMAMVRDATTGEILSFLRRPGDTFSNQGQAVEIVLSDGVRSATRTVRPRE